LGRPLDIRHITFSAAYLGIAGVGLGGRLGATTLALSAIGVLAIGLINLAVSFSLALWVAMRSQRVTFQETPALLRSLAVRLRRRPASFLVPPRETPVDAAPGAA
jgi:site-specific recombinase